jgi:hypothetical protein
LNSEKIWKIRTKNKLNSEKIWKLWKKGKLNSEQIWKIWRKGKLNSEIIWKIWKKNKLNSEKIWKMRKKSSLNCKMIWKIWEESKSSSSCRSRPRLLHRPLYMYNLYIHCFSELRRIILEYFFLTRDYASRDQKGYLVPPE